MANNIKQDILKLLKGDLMQMLVCMVMIGILFLIEAWLLFFYNGGFIFPLIFGVLIILLFCLQMINFYQFFERNLKGAAGSDKKAELLIYKKVKSLPEELEEAIKNSVEAQLSILEKNQLKASKIVLLKTEELINQRDIEIKEQFEALKAENETWLTQIKEQNELLLTQLKILTDNNAQ